MRASRSYLLTHIAETGIGSPTKLPRLLKTLHDQRWPIYQSLCTPSLFWTYSILACYSMLSKQKNVFGKIRSSLSQSILQVCILITVDLRFQRSYSQWVQTLCLQVDGDTESQRGDWTSPGSRNLLVVDQDLNPELHVNIYAFRYAFTSF